MAAPAAAPVKLPLTVRKDARDLQTNQALYLSAIEATVGVAPITFEYDLAAVYTGLEGTDAQINVARFAVENYLKNAKQCLEQGCQDDMVKANLVEKLTKKNINLVLVPEEYDAKTHADGGLLGFTNSCGMRLKDGELQIFTKKSRFGSGDDLATLSLMKVLAASPVAAGELNLADQMKLRNAQPTMDAACEQLGQALGVEKFTSDLKADYLAALESKKAGGAEAREVYVDWMPTYFEGLAKNVAKHAEDAEWKTTAIQRMSKREVRLKVWPGSLYDKALRDTDYAVEDSGAYVAIQVLDGVLYIVTTPSRIGCNISNVEFENLKTLFKAKGDELSLEQKIQIRDAAEKRAEIITSIEKSTGVSGVTWDLTADSLAIRPQLPDASFQTTFVKTQIRYMSALALALANELAEPMLKEAVAEVFTTKRVGVKIVESTATMKKMPMTAAGNNANAIQIEGGCIWVLVPVDKWNTNVDQVAHDHKLLALF